MWALQSAKVGKDPRANMDRPMPGGCLPFPPTAPSRQPPLRRWKFARLISSSHPHSGRVLFASLSVRRLLDLGTLALSLSLSLSPDCARYVAPSVTVPARCLPPRRRRQYQKGLGQPGILLTRHASTARGTYGHNREQLIRLTLFEGVPSRSHSTSDTHADSWACYAHSRVHTTSRC